MRDGAVKILAGGYFLKAFLKNMGFNWNASDGTWEKEIDTAHNTEESIKTDLNDLADEWGFTILLFWQLRLLEP